MSRKTFGELQTTTKDLISQASGNVASSSVANFIKEHLNSRYHIAQSKLSGYIVQDLPQTASTVANQQRYHYPPQIYPPIESATMEIGDVDYPLTVVHSQKQWDSLNQIDFSGTTIPQFIFPMRDHFELWPIPAASGDTITLVCNMLDRDMTAEDYTTGTVTVTENSATVEGASTTFTAYMAGRWFKTTNDPTFYRINSFTDTDTIVLETVWEGITGATQTYTIGECPELPPELHHFLPWGAASDFYAGPRKDPTTAQAMNNYFWTGDFNNSSRDTAEAVGGILGAVKKYSRRDNSHIIDGGQEATNRFDERFTSTISSTI